MLQVHAEWVEIYQQHYKKPLRPLSTHTVLEKPGFERATQGNRIYINNSLPEYNWNQTVQKVFFNDIRRNQDETSSLSYQRDISEAKPTTVENVETEKQSSMILQEPVIAQGDTNANFIYHEVPIKSTAVVIQRIKPTETTNKPVQYNDFEIKDLEIYNLSDAELVPDESTTNFLNKKKVYPQLTIAAPKFKTSLEHSLTTKIPNQELSKFEEQELYEDHWPIHEDRYEYVVQIVPSNSHKRRVDIVRNTVKPNVLKTSNDNIFQSYIPTSTPTSISKHNLKTNNVISKPEKEVIVRDTTIIPKLQYSSKPQHLRQKAQTKATTTTIQPQPEIETVISEIGNNEQTRLIHLSTNIFSENELKNDKNRIQSSSSIPTTDPEKVMLDDILKNEDMSPEIILRKPSRSNTGIIKRVYPTKITKVDKNGLETGSYKLVAPTRGVFMDGELTTLKPNKENEDKHFYRIPNQANIKRVSAFTQKHINKTVVIKKPTNRPITTQSIDEGSVSIADNDDIYKPIFKGNYKPTLKITSNKTPSLTTEQYNTNIFDRNKEKNDPGSYESYITLQDKIPEFITKENHFNRQQELDDSKVHGNVDIDVQNFDVNANLHNLNMESIETSIKKVSEGKVTENPIHVKTEHKQDYDTMSEVRDQETFEDTSSSVNKPSTMETLMKVLKIVTDTIKRNTRRNFNSKVRYLEDLRDTISRSIGM